jgi:adenine/guanine phosphoribosyltransferase-like PRPP-binding protein
MPENQTTDGATAEAVLAALDAAHVALLDAAVLVAQRYGQGAQQAVQLCGAAAMIAEDWMPAIRAEVMQ